LSYIRLLLIVLVTSIFAVACDFGSLPHSGPEYGSSLGDIDQSNYYIAIHPLHNPKKLAEAYQPLVEYMNTNVPEASFMLEAIKVGYYVIAMAGDAFDAMLDTLTQRENELQEHRDHFFELVEEHTVELQQQKVFTEAVLDNITDDVVACNKDGRLSYF
jgi:hypothetical protein